VIDQAVPAPEMLDYPEYQVEPHDSPGSQNGSANHGNYFPAAELQLSATRPLKVAGALVGGNTTCIIAGPPYVESVDVAHAACRILQSLDIQFIRSRAF
jgi:hypothetical protein